MKRHVSQLQLIGMEKGNPLQIQPWSTYYGSKYKTIIMKETAVRKTKAKVVQGCYNNIGGSRGQGSTCFLSPD